MEVDSHKTLVSVNLLDQQCVVKELVVRLLEGKLTRCKKSSPKEFTLEAGESKGQQSFVDTRIDQKKWSPLLVDSDWSALCSWASRRLESARDCSGS